jgi:hypothetical protein
MLNFSMSVSVDRFIADREGAFEWSAPSDELFRFHAIRSSWVAARRTCRRSPDTSHWT